MFNILKERRDLQRMNLLCMVKSLSHISKEGEIPKKSHFSNQGKDGGGAFWITIVYFVFSCLLLEEQDYFHGIVGSLFGEMLRNSTALSLHCAILHSGDTGNMWINCSSSCLTILVGKKWKNFPTIKCPISMTDAGSWYYLMSYGRETPINE